MKDVKFTLEFTTHVLANGTGPTGEKDCFQRDNEKNLVWQQAWWYSAFAQAIDLARIKGIKPGDIHMNLSVKAALCPPRSICRRQNQNATASVMTNISPYQRICTGPKSISTGSRSHTNESTQNS